VNGLRQILRRRGKQEKSTSGFRKRWSRKNFVSRCKDKEITLCWSHRETQLERMSSKKPYQEIGLPQTTRLGNTIRLERVLRVTDDRSQWRLEKDDPWFGQH